MRNANPSLYPSDAAYHVFYDSRTNKVNFQDANGMTVKPDANARNFVVAWHDGSSTDWRYIDAALAARVPATAKADQLAHIVWAIKSATLAPRVILGGGAQDLADAQYYVAGKAAPQFGGATYAYNNDFHGMLATDGKISSDDAAKLNSLGISTILATTAADQYPNKSIATASSSVRIVDGIDGASASIGRGQAIQFTSKMGPVVWSVIEGPLVGKIDRNGLFTAMSSKGTAHVVAVSQANHSVIAVASVSVAPPTSGPTVTTKAITGLTSSGATFNGTVNPNGASGTAGFEYSLSSTFVPAYNTATVPASGSTTTPISVAETRLSVGTKYYVRALFSDSTSHKTTFGNSISFTTWGSFITTTNGSAATSSGATLNAIVNAGGVAGFVYFKYSPDNFVHVYQTPHIAVAGDFTTHTVSYTVTKLLTATSYKYEPIFDQSGAGGTVRTGAVKTFKTFGIFAENSQPVWATSITQHGATFPGKYGTGGGPAEVWIEISSNPAGPFSVYHPFNVAAGVTTYQSASITVNTLSSGTTYYIRYAIKNTDNGYTYRYPYTRSFTTLGAQSVSLASSFNREGIVTDGTTFASGLTTAYDGGCCSLSATLLGSSTTFAGIKYSYGAANTTNTVYGTGQTINLPAGNWSNLKFLGSGVNGNQSGTFVVNYTDGTNSTFSQNMSDWFTPQSYVGESIAATTAHRDLNGGGTDNRTFYVYGYSFAVNSAKTIKSITLPTNSNINVLAITLNH
jgi:hypothetical protein